jgi:hypothetical protein
MHDISQSNPDVVSIDPAATVAPLVLALEKKTPAYGAVDDAE